MIAQDAPPLSPDDLSSAENQALLAALLSCRRSRENRWKSGWPSCLNCWRARAQAMVVEVRKRPSLTDEKLVKDLGDSVLRLRERNLKRQVQQLEFLIRESAEAEDRDESRRLHELMTGTRRKSAIFRSY